MSPSVGAYRRRAPRFPRVSGDEPKTEMTESRDLEFSPRERG